MLKVFSGTKKLTLKPAEKEQYKELLKLLYEEFNPKEESNYLFIDYILGNKQFDAILFRNNALIILEMKGYSGEIHGNENNNWYVEKDGKEIVIQQDENPYRQVKDQRFALMNYMNNTILPKIERFSEGVSHIAGWVHFLKGSTYDDTQLDINIRQWFKVVNPSNLIEIIKDEESREFLFRGAEMEFIAKSFGGFEFDIRKMGIGLKKSVQPKEFETEFDLELPEIEALEKKYEIPNGFLHDVIQIEKLYVHQPKRHAALKELEELIANYAE